MRRSIRLLVAIDWVIFVVDVLIATPFLLFGIVGMWTGFSFSFRVFVIGAMAAGSAVVVAMAKRETRLVGPNWRWWQIWALGFGLAKYPLLVAILGAGPGPHK
jgi:hypothetical protein